MSFFPQILNTNEIENVSLDIPYFDDGHFSFDNNSLDLVLFRNTTKHKNSKMEQKKQISDLSRNLMVRLLRAGNINFVTGRSEEHKFRCFENDFF
jgi:hypothetical protein